MEAVVASGILVARDNALSVNPSPAATRVSSTVSARSTEGDAGLSAVMITFGSPMSSGSR
jgi:hypothetical protein